MSPASHLGHIAWRLGFGITVEHVVTGIAVRLEIPAVTGKMRRWMFAAAAGREAEGDRWRAHVAA